MSSENKEQNGVGYGWVFVWGKQIWKTCQSPYMSEPLMAADLGMESLVAVQ